MKIIFNLILFLFPIYLLSAELNTELNYFSGAIRKIENDALQATTIYEKFSVIEDLDCWLKLLAKADFSEDEVDRQLSDAQPSIEALIPLMEEIDHFFHPDSMTDSFNVDYQGNLVIAYRNSYLNKGNPPHSAETIDRFYAAESESYRKHKIFDIQRLDKTLSGLKTGIVYIYVITEDGEFLISKWQNYSVLKDKQQKIKIAPNHALLADGKAVIVAGDFELIGNEKNPIWLVSVNSGHYRPQFSSRVHILEHLIQMGIPKERIILSKIPFYAIPWKLMHFQHDNGKF